MGYLKEYRIKCNGPGGTEVVESGGCFAEARDKALAGLHSDIKAVTLTVWTMGNVIESPTMLEANTYVRDAKGWRISRRG